MNSQLNNYNCLRGAEINKKNSPQKNKFNLKKMKKNTIKSLNEVECFLHDFNKFCNYIKLYKILK